MTRIRDLFQDSRQGILAQWYAQVKARNIISDAQEQRLFLGAMEELLDSLIDHLAQGQMDNYYTVVERLAQRVAASSLSFASLVQVFDLLEEAYTDILQSLGIEAQLQSLRELRPIYHRTMAIISEQFFAYSDWKIMAMAKLCEVRDTETSGHLERTRQYCALLAQALGQGDNYVERITWASTLHDLGKIRTPDIILQKNGALTEEERATMRRHTTDGARILDEILAGQRISIENYRMMRDIILYHHEKMDGTGYPYGLKGIAIPLAARIAALADAYDAITSLRPYKAPLPHSEAVARIVASSGTHFDPLVVQAFLKVEEQFRSLRSKDMDEIA